MQGWVRGLLSVFVLFQVGVALVAPNADNPIGETVRPLVEPYIGFFELSNRWSFFAPEPGPPPVFVEWELVNPSGDAYQKGSWPEQQSPFILRERQNRRLAAAEFMLPSEDRVEKIMVPYLCGKFPEANSVRLWRVAYTVPTMDEVVTGKRKIGDAEKMERHLVSHSFCADSRTKQGAT